MPLCFWFLCTHCHLLNRLSGDSNQCHCFWKSTSYGTLRSFLTNLSCVPLYIVIYLYTILMSKLFESGFEPSPLSLKTNLPHLLFTELQLYALIHVISLYTLSQSEMSKWGFEPKFTVPKNRPSRLLLNRLLFCCASVKQSWSFWIHFWIRVRQEDFAS